MRHPTIPCLTAPVLKGQSAQDAQKIPTGAGQVLREAKSVALAHAEAFLKPQKKDQSPHAVKAGKEKDTAKTNGTNADQEGHLPVSNAVQL